MKGRGRGGIVMGLLLPQVALDPPAAPAPAIGKGLGQGGGTSHGQGSRPVETLDRPADGLTEEDAAAARAAEEGGQAGWKRPVPTATTASLITSRGREERHLLCSTGMNGRRGHLIVVETLFNRCVDPVSIHETNRATHKPFRRSPQTRELTGTAAAAAAAAAAASVSVVGQRH